VISGECAVSISMMEAWSMTVEAAGFPKYWYLCTKQCGITSQERARWVVALSCLIKVEIGLESVFEITEVFHSVIVFMFAFMIVPGSATYQHLIIPHIMFIL
jgi:hypothetical protein